MEGRFKKVMQCMPEDLSLTFPLDLVPKNKQNLHCGTSTHLEIVSPSLQDETGRNSVSMSIVSSFISSFTRFSIIYLNTKSLDKNFPRNFHL